MKSSIKTLTLIAALAVATSALAFPTKVRVTEKPDLLSSEGTEVFVKTNRGSVTIDYRNPVYHVLARAKVGQCFIFETETETNVDFNRKVNKSGLNTVTKSRC